MQYKRGLRAYLKDEICNASKGKENLMERRLTTGS